MVVVGAHLLASYWGRHPEAEARLRALHALLSRSPPGNIERLLAGGKWGPDGRVRVILHRVEVVMQVASGDVLRIESVEEAL